MLREILAVCVGHQQLGGSRHLVRSRESYNATIENNTLTDVSDGEKLTNVWADRKIGIEKPLQFECGVHSEFSVNGWKARSGVSNGAS